MALTLERKHERDARLLRAMAQGRPLPNGRVPIVDPRTTLRVARRVNRERGAMPLSRACAVLEKESGGGHNVFGHDKGGAVIGGTVTRESYGRYLARVRRGQGGRQGVGGMQLTSAVYQDEADRLGGCWRPNINMYVGLSALAENIKKHGIHEGMRRYNGSGKAAEAYAHDLRAREAKWRAYFDAALKQPAPMRPSARPPRRPSLARGDKGHAVVVMTRRLSFVPSLASGRPYLDGKRSVFDAAAEQALRRFQAERGLKVSGRFGPKTSGVLARAVAAEKRRRSGPAEPSIPSPVTGAGSPPPNGGIRAGTGSAELLAQLEQLDVRGDRVRAALLERRDELEQALEQERHRQEHAESERQAAHPPLGAEELPILTEQLSRLLHGLLTDVRSTVEGELHGERQQRMSADDELRSLIVAANGDRAAEQPSPSLPADRGPEPLGAVENGSSQPAAPTPAGSPATAASPAAAMPTGAGIASGGVAVASESAEAGPGGTPGLPPRPDAEPPTATPNGEPGLDDLLARLDEIDAEDDRIRALLAERYAELEARVIDERRRHAGAEAEPPHPNGLPPEGSASGPAIEALQRSLNRFTSKYLRGVAPLPVDGVMDAATSKRIKRVKFYLGYGANPDSSVKPLFIRRLQHPHSKEHSSEQMLVRGAKRRKAQRARHARRHGSGNSTPAGTWQQLRRSLNRFTTKYLRGVPPLAVDGANNEETRRRIELVKFYLGYGRKRDGSVKPLFVRRLRHPHSGKYSSQQMLARAARRRKAQRKRAAEAGTLGERALHVAGSLVGKMEQGHNAGPFVSKIIRENSGAPGDAWCGHFVAYCYRHAGSTVVQTRWAGVRFLGGLIGQRRVADPRPGDIVVFPAGQGHTGLFVRHIPGGIETIEGNTSAAGAVSPKTGGEGVYIKHRSNGEVGRYVRVLR